MPLFIACIFTISLVFMSYYNFWIFERKLLGVLVLLTTEANVLFDSDDYKAILYGLTTSDSENGNYFEYTFLSENDFTIFLAKEIETDIIQLRIKVLNSQFKNSIEYIDRFQASFDNWTIKNEDYFKS